MGEYSTLRLEGGRQAKESALIEIAALNQNPFAILANRVPYFRKLRGTISCVASLGRIAER